MKILVIGGCGFIGSHIVDRLVSAGMTVAVLDHRQEVYRLPVPGVTYHCGSWFENGLLDRMLLNGGFSCVVHLGWTTTPYTSNLDPRRDAHENVVGSLSVLDACVRGKVTSVIFASSGGTVYGPSDLLPLSEEQPTEPISAYGIAKLAVEKYLQLYQRNFGIATSILRISNPFGPRQNPDRSQGAVAVFAQRILTGGTIEIWGDGSSIRDYLFVTDVAEAFLRAAISNTPGIYNIGSGRGASLMELINTIERLTGIRAIVTLKPPRNVDVPAVVLNPGRAGRLLNWSPCTTFDEGLQKTIAWLSSKK